MKTILRFSITAMVLLSCMLLSCSKEKDFDQDNTGATAYRSASVITVSPSGNYEDDSYNIQTALNNAVAAGPGSTVKLTAGTFYLKYKIEIDGFDGYFKGAGKQNTILTTHDQINWNLPPFADNLCLITFRHGYTRMSDLTFNITQPEPCVSDWENAVPTIIMVAGSRDEDPPVGDQCGSSVFNNINFICGPGNFYGYNVVGFVNIGADRTASIIGGNQKITSCLFEGSVNSLTNWSDNNATWLIGGNGSSGNTFKNAHWPLTIGEFNNSTAEISYNHFEGIDWGPIYITQGMFSDYSERSLSTFLIQHNTLEAVECDGITIFDVPNHEGYGKTIDAIIQNNQVEMNSEGYWGGIFGFAADDIIVKANQVWGKGLAGICSGLNGDATTNWFIQGNNVQNVTALVAPIWLGEGTSYYTVIGGSNKTNVWDEGTNNTLTGVTKIQGNDLGQQVQQAHALQQQIMIMFKNH